MNVEDILKAILGSQYEEKQAELMKHGRDAIVNAPADADPEITQFNGQVVKVCDCESCRSKDTVTFAAVDKDGNAGLGAIHWEYLNFDAQPIADAVTEVNAITSASTSAVTLTKQADTIAQDAVAKAWEGTSKVPVAVAMLQEAANTLHDRAVSRDTPEGERSIGAAVAAFNAIYGTDITPQQGWMFMVFLKAARSANGQTNMDDFVDGAAYFALAGEEASKQ